MEPYDIYSKLSFNIIIGHFGDCYDRYLIRINEMKESVRIILQCIELIHFIDTNVSKFNFFYDFNVDNYKIINKNRHYTKLFMENIIHHFKIYTEGTFIPKEYVYKVVEAPKGEFGIFLFSDNSNKPYRCRIKAPGFLHLQSLNFMSKDHLLADLVTILGTQDIVFGEVDR